jgi:hypothetical protein
VYGRFFGALKLCNIAINALFYLKIGGVKMCRSILAISLALVVAVSITSCIGVTKDEVELPTAQEIIDEVIESFDNIKAYQFDMDMDQDQVGETEGVAFERAVTIDNSGALDLEDMQMRASLSMRVVEPGEDEVVEAMEMYIIDNMMYAKPEVSGEESVWMKSELPAGTWEMMKGISALENYLDLLETAQVEVIGSEEVNEVDCYVLQLTPEMEQLWRSVGPGGIGEGRIAPTIPRDFLQDIFQSFSIKHWIAKNTYFIMKTEIDMITELTAEVQEYFGEEGTISMDTSLVFQAYNYNQPVSIELPLEAEEAVE